MMSRTFRALAVTAVVVTALAGCRTVTGRSAGTYIDDATTTAKVKTAIGGVQIGTISRVDVDTRHGVVYLIGTAMNEQSKQQIVEAARGAAEGKTVVDHLVLAGQTPPAAANQQTSSQAAASPSTVQPLTSRFSRIEPEPGGADATGRFVAYDKSGKQVATIYSIAAQDLDRRSMANLDTGTRQIDHVSVYPHAGSDGMQYHVVLWHVDRQEAGALQ